MLTHLDIRKILVERLSELLESRHQLPVELRPYQIETLGAQRSWLEDLSGTHQAYVEEATGLGKTVEFAAFAAFCTTLRVLVVVPTKMLVEQAARATVKFTGGMLGFLASLNEVRDEQGRVIAKKGLDHSNIVITTDESLLMYPRKIAGRFQPHVILFDECHWGTRISLSEFFPEAVIIGFSSTPDYLTTTARSDYQPVHLDNGQVLHAAPYRLAKKQFGTLIARRTVPWGITNGWLAPLAWDRIDFDVSLEGLPVYEGEGGLDYQASALSSRMNENWSKITRTIRRLYESGRYNLANRQVFAVCPSIAAAEELAQAIRELGVPSAAISNRTSTKDRNAHMAAFARNKMRLLTSVMILREGVDAPNAEVCMMLRPTKSYVVYVQPTGRILRLFGDKVSLVLDGHFKDTTYEPLSAPQLFGPVGREVVGGGLLLGKKQGAAGPAPMVATSPYLSGADIQRYRVERIARELYASKDGTFEVDDELWGSEYALVTKLGVDVAHLKAWSEEEGIQVRAQDGKTYEGRSTTFYAMKDVQAVAQKIGHGRWSSATA